MRDYIHVSDLVAAHSEALSICALVVESEVFNCGYGHGFSVLDVIEAVKKVAKNDFEGHNVKSPRRRPGGSGCRC